MIHSAKTCRRSFRSLRTPFAHRVRANGISCAMAIMCPAGFIGCTITSQKEPRKELGVDPTASILANSAAYKDTIGSIAYFEGLAPMRVRGYGVVVGLGKNGSSDCPRPIYDRLIQNLYKQHQFSSSVVGTRNITPEQLLADLDTAVVVVQGEIPPAAVTGTRFDVYVSALPGTQTKSLRGGRLYTTDLEVFRVVTSDVSITGQVLARAAGPLFYNPFSDESSATQVNPLEAVVIGGGGAVTDRRLRLVLQNPSYTYAQRIQDRINAQFPGSKKAADAVSPSFVQLRVPDEFENDRGHFLNLVRALYLSRDPQFEAVRATELAEELLIPTAPHAQISLCFEGLGRAALPVLGELYGHAKDYVSFHAAVAGLRLDDHLAADTLALHAANPQSEHRFAAIRALGEARSLGSTGFVLRKLLDDSDPRVQVAAYEAIFPRGDPAVHSEPLGGDNFILDQVTTTQPNFVYAKRSGTRRIALFGRGLRCTPPLLYRSPDGGLTLNAADGESNVTVLRSVVARGSSSPEIPAPLELAPLLRLLGDDAGTSADGEATGLGLPYADVVRTAQVLAQSKSMNAGFVLEQPNAMEMFGPPRTVGRPESELR